MQTLREVQQAGITLYVTKTGEIRMKAPGLHPAALKVLRAHKPDIIAEWLWTSLQTPAVLQWDDSIAEAILAFAMRLMAHPRLERLDDADDMRRAEAAVDWAYQSHQLVAVFEAAKTWVLAVADHAVPIGPTLKTSPASSHHRAGTDSESSTDSERGEPHGSTHRSTVRNTRDIA